MNILMLGGAKRVTMARMMLDAARRRGEECRLYSYEMSTHVPIAICADVIVGKRWNDPEIYEDLHRLIERHDIKIVVPFVDGAVAVAATLAQLYPDEIFAPTTSAEMAELMFDKVKAAEEFEKLGLAIPKTFHASEATLVNTPLIAKPRHGSASKGLIIIDNLQQLESVVPHADDYLIQERIDQRKEYTVDCYVSVRTGEIVTIVPRLRIEISGGEVTHTETVFCPEVFDLAKETLEKTGLRGAVTIQILYDTTTGRYMLMEINPRLGGGAVCSVFAGADLPNMIMADAKGESLPFVCYRPNTEIVRYQQEKVFYN